MIKVMLVSFVCGTAQCDASEGVAAQMRRIVLAFLAIKFSFFLGSVRLAFVTT
jgi:hypothetical protein